MAKIATIKTTVNGAVTTAQVTYDGLEESDCWKAIGQCLGNTEFIADDNVEISTPDGNALLTARYDEINEKLDLYPVWNKIKLLPSRYEKKSLRKVDAETNTHLMYDMIPNNMGPRTIDIGAVYGETGGTNARADLIQNAYVLKRPYQPYMFWIKYYQLLREGYQDLTDMMVDHDADSAVLDKYFHTEQEVDTNMPERTAAMVLYEHLHNAAKATLASVINIDFMSSKPPVSKKQIKSAWELWKTLGTVFSVKEMNDIIGKLIAVTDVSFKNDVGHGKKAISDFMIQEIADPDKQTEEIAKVVDNWEQIINAMESMLPAPMNDSTFKDEVLSPFGNINVEFASEEDTNRILDKFHTRDNLFYKVYKLTCPKFEERMKKYCEDENITDIREFVHGSSTCNWESIIKNGLLLNPNAKITGKAFGNGIYTARDFQKSLGYTSFSGSKWASGSDARGYIGVYSTAYGKPLMAQGVRDYLPDVTQGGYNCLDAKRGNTGFCMDEIVFYREEALCLKYIIEFSDDKKFIED